MALYFVHWSTGPMELTTDLIRCSRAWCDYHGGGFVLDADGMRRTSGLQCSLDGIYAIELRKSVADFAGFPDRVLFDMFEAVKVVRLVDPVRSEMDLLCRLLGGLHKVRIECADAHVKDEILRNRQACVLRDLPSASPVDK